MAPRLLHRLYLGTPCHTLQTRRAALPPARESNETSVGIATWYKEPQAARYNVHKHIIRRNDKMSAAQYSNTKSKTCYYTQLMQESLTT